MKEGIKKIAKIGWGAIKGGLKELGLSDDKIDEITKEFENNINIAININNTFSPTINVSSNYPNNDISEYNLPKKNKLSFEDSAFMGSIIKKYIMGNLSNLEKIVNEFTLIINEKYETLFFSRQTPTDLESYNNHFFQDFIQRKVINSELFNEDEKKKIHNIWIEGEVILDLRDLLKKLGFKAKRI